ncbi:LuxR C-terminal-related transcriptional regulator [Alcaligenaceae bacterium CGII-47]|nr:LuxR C-terminal-related transcriptional regulator [Alcaligenaceae bacterium CGII-47]
MLLSVPNVYDQMVELVHAAQTGYSPQRILLLSDTPTLPYSLLKLSNLLAGYISKYSSQDAVISSIMLVLAGGKCFPLPDTIEKNGLSAEEDGLSDSDVMLKRRWYDKDQLLPKPSQDLMLPTKLSAPAEQPQGIRPSTLPSDHLIANREPQALSPELRTQESVLLNLTPRQYEVLTLLARGYSVKKVSSELGISVATTKAHTEALYQRLSVNNRNTAVYTAVQRGATLGWFEAHPPSN